MAPEEGWDLKFVAVPRPQLLVSQDAAHPQLPSLPTAQLVLPDSPALRGYYGEEFHGMLLAVPKHYSVDDLLGSLDGSNEKPEQQLASDEPERIHISARLVSADGSTKNFPSHTHEISAVRKYGINAVNFDMNYPGKWQLQASLQIEHELETQTLSKTFEIDVRPAVSIRFKVSRGTPEVKAHVLEAQVENLADGALSVESCELVPKNGWKVESVQAGVESLESSSAILLRPHEVFQYCFLLRGGRSAEAAALTLGWHREPVGSQGRQTTAPVRI